MAKHSFSGVIFGTILAFSGLAVQQAAALNEGLPFLSAPPAPNLNPRCPAIEAEAFEIQNQCRQLRRVENAFLSYLSRFCQDYLLRIAQGDIIFEPEWDESEETASCRLYANSYINAQHQRIDLTLRLRDLWVEYIRDCNPNAFDIAGVNVYDPCITNGAGGAPAPAPAPPAPAPAPLGPR